MEKILMQKNGACTNIKILQRIVKETVKNLSQWNSLWFIACSLYWLKRISNLQEAILSEIVWNTALYADHKNQEIMWQWNCSKEPKHWIHIAEVVREGLSSFLNRPELKTWWVLSVYLSSLKSFLYLNDRHIKVYL